MLDHPWDRCCLATPDHVKSILAVMMPGSGYTEALQGVLEGIKISSSFETANELVSMDWRENTLAAAKLRLLLFVLPNLEMQYQSIVLHGMTGF